MVPRHSTAENPVLGCVCDPAEWEPKREPAAKVLEAEPDQLGPERVELPEPVARPLPEPIRLMAERGIRVHPGLWALRAREARDAFRELDAPTDADRDRMEEINRYAERVLDRARHGRVVAEWTEHPHGRFYTSRPNLQGITKDGGFRDCVIPADGSVFVVGDWRSSHFWVAAGLSRDEALHVDLENGDLYRRAADVWAPGEADEDRARAAAKVACLATLNGAGGATLAEKLAEHGVHVDEATAIARRAAWFALYPELRNYVDRIRGEPSWETPDGRTVVGPEGADAYKRPAWRWMSFEACALVRAVEHVPHLAVLTLHDEIVLEVPEAEAERAVEDLRLAMDESIRRAVGLPAGDPTRTAKVEIRPSWSGVVPAVWPEAPSDLPLLVVNGPGWWVWDGGSRYLAVPKGIVPVEVSRIHGVQCEVFSENGSSRWMNQAELHAAHGVAAQSFAWSCAVDQPSWDPIRRELVVPAGRFRRGEARFSKRCDGYLRALAGAEFERVADWIAVLDRQDAPCAALALIGRPGSGKGLFASAVTTLFGGFVAYSEAMSRFNGGLASFPFVWLDERSTFQGGSDMFRSLIGNRVHRLEAKYQNHQELRGCIRLLATSNSNDPFRLGQDELSIDDDDAIGVRLVLVRVNDDGRTYLEGLEGKEPTKGWCEPDGELVAHMRWIVANRQVTPGRRFLVEGGARDYTEKIGTQTGLPGTILDAIASYLLDSNVRIRVSGTAPFIRDSAEPMAVLVSSSRLLDAWTRLVGGKVTPSSVALGNALKKLSPRGNVKVTLKDTGNKVSFSVERLRAFVIPLDLLGDRLDAEDRKSLGLDP